MRRYRVAVAALPPGEEPPPPGPDPDEAGATEVEAPNIAAAAAKAVRREWPGHPHPEQIAASACSLEDEEGEPDERSEPPRTQGRRYSVEGGPASIEARVGPKGETDDLGGSPRCFYADSPWEAIEAWGAREPWPETDPLRVVVTLRDE